MIPPMTVSRRALLASALAVPVAGCAGVSGRSDDQVATPLTPAAGGVQLTLSRTILSSIAVPWGLTFWPDGRCLIGERDTHRLWVYHPNGRSLLQGVVGGIAGHVRQNEGGLLGLALKPGDPLTVFAYITTATDNRVVKFQLNRSGVTRPTAVLTGIPTRLHHHGGALLFAPDGTLFVSTGDAQNSAQAQNRSSLAGKILRITQSGKPAPGNPFGNAVWSYGHRNVEGLAFDAQGRLWATEFGNTLADELNLIVKGGNYGWPVVEGRSSNTAYRNPAATWSPTSTCSPSGIAITRSTAFIGALQGRCVYAVPLSGTNAGTPVKWFAGKYGRIRKVVAAPDGSLWVTTSNMDDNGSHPAGGDRILRFMVR